MSRGPARSPSARRRVLLARRRALHAAFHRLADVQRHLGQAPTPATRLERVLDARARLLAETVSGVPRRGGPPADPSLAVVVRRLEHGRLLTALG